MDKKNIAISVLSGFVVCALIAVLLLGLYCAGLIGKNNKKDNKTDVGQVETPSTEKGKLELHDGMTLNEFRAWMSLTRIDGITTVTVDKDAKGNVTNTEKSWYVKNGYIVENYNEKNELVKYTFAYVENNRFYEKILYDGVWKERIIDLDGTEIVLMDNSLASAKKVTYELILAILSYATGSDFEDGDVTDADILFNVSGGVVTSTAASGENSTLTMSDFNKTTLPFPEDFDDMKGKTATETLGKYNLKQDADGNDYYELTSIGDLFDDSLCVIKKFTVPAEINGIPVKEITSSNTKLQELVVPASVTAFGEYNISCFKSITYLGTKEQWKNVKIGSYTGEKPLTVCCTDGDVTITKNA